MTRHPGFRLYGLVTDLAAPVIRQLLRRRLKAGKELEDRLPERFGHASRPRPEGVLVWTHAASVGESLSLLPLLEALLARLPHAHVLVTTGTVTSAKLIADRLPPRAFHQFVPVDQLGAVRSFLRHWRPDLALFVESELWPNLVLETQAAAVPMVLLNARLSARSAANWAKLPVLASGIFGSFARILAQDEVQADRIRQLGARNVGSVGDLKAAGPPPPADAEVLARLQAAIGGRPVWLAASTHAGEEEIVAEAHRLAAAAYPDLLTILAPRHPQRIAEVVSLLGRMGFQAQRHSQAGVIDDDTQVYLVDTLGEMGVFYRLAPIVLIGGSLKPVGGHNPLEAARLARAILHGPDMFSAASVTRALDTAGAARQVADAGALAAAVTALLGDESLCREMGEAAQAVARGQAAVLDRVLAELEPWIAALTAKSPGSIP
ncbi:MAG TPA: 3-deoxy-D-manno-octulosonic acid transferase [Stellaceae bacterium]|nr:3-deoxy-D-manno-octulosonic acid transferase [Stellaceae bacterium]